MSILSLILTTVFSEFPIATGAGDQLYPDVCWDGKAFWIVWAENQGDSGKIFATKVNETGSVDEPFLVCSPGKGISDPSLACSPDTLLLTYTRQVPDSANEDYLCFSLLDSSGKLYQGSGGGVGIFAAGPIIPVRCKEHFALLYTHGFPAEIEYPTLGEVALLDRNTPKIILEVPAPKGQFCYVDGGVWNGERLFCVTSSGCIYLEDTLEQDPNQGGYFYPRDPWGMHWDSLWFYNRVALAAASKKIGMIYSEYGNPWFDFVDGNGSLINSEPLFIDSTQNYWQSSLAFGKGRFLSVSEVGEHPGPHTIWGTEIDTNVTLIDEGYLKGGPMEERYPDICFGKEHFLLAWCDNRSGDWDIYGRILDSLPYSGIEEPPSSPVPPLGDSPSPLPKDVRTIEVDKTCFTDRLRIILLNGSGEEGIVTIRDAVGRVVKTLETQGSEAVWDGRGQDGTALNKGVFFVSPEQGSGERPVKVVKL